VTDELYPIPAKPTTYKGVPMKSGNEVTIARALDDVGLAWKYEAVRYADNRDYYTPDFHITIEVVGLAGFPSKQSCVHVEAKPYMNDEKMLRHAIRRAQILEQSTDDPLLFVGLQELRASLAGWLISGDGSAVLGAITRRRKYETAGFKSVEEPCLYIGQYAEAWLDGFNAASFDQLVLPNFRDFR